MKTSLPKLMLVDENSFIFHPTTEEDKSRNAYVLTFLRDAQRVFRTVVVADRDCDVVRADLEKTDFSEALNPKYKIQQSFLTTEISSWDDYEGKRADVIISADENIRYKIDDYDFIKHPESLQSPGYFHYFWECYEDNLIMSFRGLGALSAHVAMSNFEIVNKVKRTYPDVDAVWKKVLQDPDVIELAHAFADARQRFFKKQHPQDDVMDQIKDYFRYVSIGSRISDKYGPKRNLDDSRDCLMTEFRRYNIDGLYERDLNNIEDNVLERPLAPQHRRLANRALMAVHRIVKNEPTKQL